jgi:serine O-acetyltransferase
MPRLLRDCAADVRAVYGPRITPRVLLSASINASIWACLLLRCASRAPRWCFWLFRTPLLVLFGIDVGWGASFGSGLRLPHPTGIVIGGGVRVGDDVTLYHHVTLGAKHDGYPRLGESVIVWPGAIIVGDIVIGESSVVGASVFVDRDVPAHTTFVGAPSSRRP